MSFLDDENLLTQLVDETLKKPSGPQELKVYELFYYSSIKCYQLEVDGKIFTFPTNWGPFAQVHKREGEGLVLEKDLELFNSVFGSLIGEEVKAAFVYEGISTYLVFVPKKMEINFKDLHSLICDQSDFKLAA